MHWVYDQVKRIQLRARVTFTNPVCFVVITPGRSGSNHLLSMFDSHPRIFHCGEDFGPSFLGNPGTRKKMELEGFLQYYKNSQTRKGFEKAIGSKFLYSYFRDEYIERYAAPELTEVYRYIRESPDIRVIHLWRENPLSVLVSFEIASLTKRFVQLRERAEEVKLNLAPAFVKYRIDEILKEQEWVRLSFRQHPFHEVSYEELVTSRERCLREMMAFLDVDAVPLSSRTKKQNSRQLSEILENFDELQSFFAGTYISPYLES
ncbi:sulfotransferase [Pseudomonadota bacterium]